MVKILKSIFRIPSKIHESWEYFWQWIKTFFCFWGAIECTCLTYQYTGAILVTYKVWGLESLPYVQLIHY